MSQEDDADLLGVDVEDQALKISRKQDQFIGPNIRQPTHPDDAVTNVLDDADLPVPKFRLLPGKDVVHGLESAVQKCLQFFLLCHDCPHDLCY